MRFGSIVTALCVPALASAQSVVSTPTDLRAAPSGDVIATLRDGATVRATGARSGWSRVTVEGYVHESVVGGRRASFSISARGDNVRLRARPSPQGTIVAELRDGAGLVRVSRKGDWLRVKRTGWVRTRALRASTKTIARAPSRRRAKPAPAAAASRKAPARDTTQQAVSTGDVAATSDSTPAITLAVERRTQLLLGPGDRAVATVDSNTRVTTLARERDWVRVQVEGWVRAADLGPADASVLTAISAADLRAQPDKYRGQTVRWVVQKIAIETADPLHKDMAPDEPYMLARGPGSENSLLYLALPPSLVDQAKRIDPLSTVIVTARVRAGRSQPSGVPLLDVLSLASK